MGWNVAHLGDINNKGRSDILIGAKKDKFYLLFGENIRYQNNQDIETSADIIFTHDGSVWDLIGHDIFRLGDYNQDGIDDFIIGASEVADSDLGAGTGKSFIFYGKRSWADEVQMNQADVIITGEYGEDAFGFSVSRGGDVDNDGAPDILISSLKNDDNGTDAGKVYLFLNTAAPTLTLLSPNGGEVLDAGDDELIRWTTHSAIKKVTLEYSIDNGDSWISIAANRDNTGSYLWTVPPTPSNRCLVRVKDASDGRPFDVSDAIFTIRDDRSIKVVTPNGGETLTAESSFEIKWTFQTSDKHVVIELSVDGGETWDAVDPHGENSGQYSWTVPDRPSTTCLIRVSASPSSRISDISDEVFTIQGSSSQRIRIEAEDVSFSNAFFIDDNPLAGNGKVILFKRPRYNGSFHVDVTLPPAVYKIFLRYLDEAGGMSQVKASLNETQIANWQWDAAIHTDVFIYYDLGSHELRSGDNLSFRIDRERNEYGQVDYIEFVKIADLPSSLILFAPNGGEKWQIGTVETITWTSKNMDDAILIQQSRDGGSTWTDVARDIPNSNRYDWQIDGKTSDSVLIVISDMDQTIADTSDTFFSITPKPQITVQAPNGGETWTIDTIETISWIFTNISEEVKIDISRDNGQSWQTITDNLPNSGSYPWTVTEPVADSCLIRVTDQTGQVSDQSDSIFTIVVAPDPMLTLLSPNGGQTWSIGETETIQWESKDIIEPIHIELSRDNGEIWETLAHAAPDSNHFRWDVTGPASDSCLVKISTQDQNVNDSSDAVFTIEALQNPLLTVIAPNGGEQWALGSVQSIRWFSQDISDSLILELSRNNGSTWETLTKIPAEETSFEWTVNEPMSESCFVKIRTQNNMVEDISDEPFGIFLPLEPELMLTFPNGGETWPIDSRQDIVWSSLDVGDSIRIQLSRDAGTSWETITKGTSNTGVFNWQVKGPPSSDCLFLISTLEDAISDTSDGSFTIDYAAGISQIDQTIPEQFALIQNFPNPFNSNTRISYLLPKASFVRLIVYNVNGDQITSLVNSKQSAGTYVVTWNGSDSNGYTMPSGVYFYRIVAGGHTAIKSMMYLR